MAYSAPAGNAAAFNFTVSGYGPVTGNAAAFPFSTSGSGPVAGGGTVQGQAVLLAVGASGVRAQGAIAGRSVLRGSSMAAAVGQVTGQAAAKGVGRTVRAGVAQVPGQARLTGVGHALASAVGSVVGSAHPGAVSRAGYHGSIQGRAALAGVGFARTSVTGSGTVQGRAQLSGYGTGANPFAVLLATRQFVMADLFTITLARTGQTLNYTSLDRPLWYQGVTFDAYGLQISGLQFKKSVGLAVDEQSITISATRDLLINGRPWFDEIANGLLDNAEIRRVRVFAADWHSPIVGSVILFDGIVSTLDSLTATQCQLKVKSYLSLLNQPMPRNAWQASCLHTLFDAGCGLSRAAFQASGVVGAGSTVTTLNWSSATPGYYWQGTVQFTSGPNAGLTRTLKLATGTQLMFHLPLPEMPLPDDTFYAWPGCDKTLATCQSRFNNTVHNRSYPYIPAPTIAL